MDSDNTFAGLGRRAFLGIAGTAAATALATTLDIGPAAAQPRSSEPMLQAGPSLETIRYPSDVMAATASDPGVLNVKTLFGAVGDGVTDDTDALIAAIDAVIGPIRDLDTSAWVGQRIIYLPIGIYRVSRTLVYSFPYFTAPNYPSSEGLRYLRFRGESQNGTVIRLADSASGFAGAPTPVLSFAKTTGANFVVASNAVEDLTIDVGKQNPGAVGLLFCGANNAAIRNVTIRSSDPDGAGAIGLRASVGSTQLDLNNVDIHGFDHSITAEAHQATQLTLDCLELDGYRVNGIAVTGSSVSIRHLTTLNASGPAVSLEDDRAHVTLIDSVVNGDAAADAAVVVSQGSLFVANLTGSNYPVTIRPSAGADIVGNVDLYTSTPIHSLFSGVTESDVEIPVENIPALTWGFGDGSAVSANSFGAVGDGVTDDTAAISAAFASGEHHIYFRPGSYLVNDTIEIPASVHQINFMYSRVAIGAPLRKPLGTSLDDECTVFRIVGSESSEPLLIEDMLCFPKQVTYRIFEHASARTVVFSDVHWQGGALYRSTATGTRAFFENVSNRSGLAADGNPAFVLNAGAKAWARHINPEHGAVEILNAGGQMWVLGFKKEGSGSLLEVSDGGHTNILGGVVYRTGVLLASNPPLVDCDNSTLGLSLATQMLPADPPAGEYWHTIVKQTEGVAIGTLDGTDLLRRGPDWGDGSERHLTRFVAKP